MKGLLSLPHSNADTKRVFSAVNLMKTKTQNKLKCQSLEALMSTKEGTSMVWEQIALGSTRQPTFYQE